MREPAIEADGCMTGIQGHWSRHLNVPGGERVIKGTVTEPMAQNDGIGQDSRDMFRRVC